MSMNIQKLLLLCLSLVLLSTLWRKMLPNEQFLELHCNVGEISRPAGSEKVIDCSSCLTFPLESHQVGKVTIRSGIPQQQKGQHPSQQYEVYANLYMQADCIEYQCWDLLSSADFRNEGIIRSAGLNLVSEVFNFVDQKVWQVQFQYDNTFPRSSVKSNFISYLMADLLPSPLLPQQFFRGMAIKLRATQPIQNMENLMKPVIKISQFAETRADLITISLIIAFTLAVKSNMFHFDHNLRVLNLVLCFGFLSPYFFSLLALVILMLREPSHTFSLFFFVLALCLDNTLLILISVVLSSILLVKESTKVLTIPQVLIFNLIIFLAAFNEIEYFISCSICLLYALGEVKLENKYQQIGSKEKNQREIQMRFEHETLTIEE